MTTNATVELVLEAERLARAAAAGDTAQAHRLAEVAKVLVRCSGPIRRAVRYSPSGQPAVDMMRQAGDGLLVRTAGEVRTALAERPGMRPVDYLRSLRLGTLPVWPLPEADDATVVVFAYGTPGVGSLLADVEAGDEPGIARTVERLQEVVTYGPDRSNRARFE